MRDDEGPPRKDGTVKSSESDADPALLLIESLIHTLVAHSVLRLGDAIDLVEAAGDVLREVHFDRGIDPAITARLVQPLDAMAASLKQDLLGSAGGTTKPKA